MRTTRTYRATMPADHTSNARNFDGEKERTDYAHLCYVTPTRVVDELVDVRWWMARRSDGASPVYCSLWIYSAARNEIVAAGHGRASGYGYCKRSAAFEAALDSAGVLLDIETDDGPKRAHIGGTGMQSVRDALAAIADTLILSHETCYVVGSV